MATIKWRGREVHDTVAEAAAVGIEATMADCVHDARSDHAAYPPASAPGEPYANRTTFATQSIHPDVAEPTLDDKVVGKWGGDADYFLFLEIGTSRRDSGAPTAFEREQAGGGNIDAVPAPSEPPLMAARPTLRPAADRNYGKLQGHIAAALAGQEIL